MGAKGGGGSVAGQIPAHYLPLQGGRAQVSARTPLAALQATSLTRPPRSQSEDGGFLSWARGLPRGVQHAGRYFPRGAGPILGLFKAIALALRCVCTTLSTRLKVAASALKTLLLTHIITNRNRHHPHRLLPVSYLALHGLKQLLAVHDHRE